MNSDSPTTILRISEPRGTLKKPSCLPPALGYVTHQVHMTWVHRILKLDGLVFEPSMEEALFAQGFEADYKVHGASLRDRVCSIKEAVPPPMADALGRFAKAHVRDLVSLTTGVDSQGCRKRKPEGHNEDGEAKRVKRLGSPLFV